jgi:hypothetical protein
VGGLKMTPKDYKDAKINAIKLGRRNLADLVILGKEKEIGGLPLEYIMKCIIWNHQKDKQEEQSNKRKKN